MKGGKMKKYILLLAVIISTVVCATMTSCKAWRTISTTATYTQVGDSTKTTTTIVTKTQEEYTGVKK
jgi:predicted S18 family serine protease